MPNVDRLVRRVRSHSASSNSLLTRKLVAIAVAATVVVAAGCSSTSTSTTSTSNATTSTSKPVSAADAAARALLPPAVTKSGVITDASSFDYPPYDYTSAAGAYQGLDVDILTAVQSVLGVKIQFVHLSGFASVIPAVQSGRVEIAMEGIGILSSRLPVVSFVRYVSEANGLLVQAGNPKHVNGKDVCGTSVAVEAGAEEVQLYQAISKACTTAGKQAVSVQIFSSEASQVLAVQTGRIDSAGVGYATAAYIASTSGGKLAVAPGGPIAGGTIPGGIVIAKSSTALGNALAKALEVLVADGTMQKIFAKWGITGQEAPAAVITSPSQL